MEFLSGYLLSIVGVVMLTVLIDLILPDGKINKYIKSIVAIMVVAVIISPVAKLIKADFDFSKIFASSNYQIDEAILDSITSKNIENYERELETRLKDFGFEGVNVSIVTEDTSGQKIIKYIYVDLCDLVINKNEEHIDYYTKIKDIVAKIVTFIREEQIVVYG